MDNHGNRPEILTALAGGVGHSLRYSSTLKHQRLYLAIPGEATPGGTLVPYVVRASVSMESLSHLLRRVYGEIALIGLALLLVAGGVSLILSRRLSVKLQTLRQGALAYAGGQLEHELDIDDPVEVADVAHAMNSMARQLEERIRKTDSQRQELAAVLASMVEGVIAVDPGEQVIRMNQVAAGLLGCKESEAMGRSIQEVGPQQRADQAGAAHPGRPGIPLGGHHHG